MEIFMVVLSLVISKPILRIVCTSLSFLWPYGYEDYEMFHLS